MKRTVSGGLALSLIVALGCAQRQNITQQELVSRTQEIMDAIAHGNPEPWKKYFADDAIYFDEKGRAMDKAALLKDVSPLPNGYSGSIRVLGANSRILDDTAILSYDLDETEDVFGQQLHARYHGTDTWVHRKGEWQIIAGQMLRYYEDPSPGKWDGVKSKQYEGTYKLAPGVTLEVTSDGKGLFLQRTGRERKSLIPEATDIFFRQGVEGRILFRRGVGGQLDALIDRRNNEDIVWRRVK